MSVKKLGVTVISTAMLTACSSPARHAGDDYYAENGIKCRREAPVGSHIKVMTCTRIDEFTIEDRERMFGMQPALDPFKSSAVSYGNAASAEGSCGSQPGGQQ